MKANTIISAITAALVLFLAGAAFVLSYEALRDLAQHNGIRPDLAWLWPLMLDAVMIAASLSVLRANLYRERAWYPWLLVGVFTVASIVFNVTHAGDALLAQAIAALPPAVVFLAFELLMGQTKATVKRQGLTACVVDLATQAADKRQEVDGLTAEVTTLAGKRDALQAELADLRQQKRQVLPAVSDDTKRQAAAILAERSAISGAELGRLLGKSASLGRQLKRELLPASATGDNGNNDGHTLRPTNEG